MNVTNAETRLVEDWLRALDAQERLSQGGHSVLQAAVQDPKFASFASASEMAAAAGVNVATVTRTAQATGFAGWPDLRQEIRARYLGNLSAPELASIHQGGAEGDSPFDRALSHNIEQLTGLRRRADRRRIAETARIIADSRRRLVIGSGSFESVARILAHHATVSGYRMEVAADSVQIANAMSDMGKGDLVIVITFWRLYNSAIRAAESARACGAKVCVITDASIERLGQVADHLVTAPADSTSFFPTIVPGLTVIEGIAAELAALDPDHTRRAVERFEREWLRHDLLYHRTAPQAGPEGRG